MEQDRECRRRRRQQQKAEAEADKQAGMQSAPVVSRCHWDRQAERKAGSDGATTQAGKVGSSKIAPPSLARRHIRAFEPTLRHSQPQQQPPASTIMIRQNAHAFPLFPRSLHCFLSSPLCLYISLSLSVVVPSVDGGWSE